MRKHLKNVFDHIDMATNEMVKILEIAGNDFPWFLPAIEFSIRNPIHPKYLFKLKQPDNFDRETLRIHYVPEGTTNRNELKIVARPVIFPDIEDYYKNLYPPEVNVYLFTRPGLNSLGEDTGLGYPIYNEYRCYFKKILRIGGIEGVIWEDLRYCALKYLMELGLTHNQIQEIGGWITGDKRMIWPYYRDPINIDITAKKLWITSKEAKNKADKSCCHTQINKLPDQHEHGCSE